MLKKINRFFKRLDYVIILFAAAFIIFASYKIYFNPSHSALIKIKGAGQEWFFPLDAEEKVIVSGPLGDTIVQIHNKSARIVKSPCINQICLTHGVIHKQGTWIACLPNKVFLVIEGFIKDGNDADAVVW